MEKLGLQFDGITSGFLGSKKQIEIVTQFFKDFKTKENIIIVDPVMGDYGKIYATYTKEMCEEMKKLVQYADIITPNITELCILTDTPYQEKWKISELEKMTEELAEKGPEKIVVTGIVQKEFIANFCYEKGKSPKSNAVIVLEHNAQEPEMYSRLS